MAMWEGLTDVMRTGFFSVGGVSVISYTKVIFYYFVVLHNIVSLGAT